MGGAMTDIVMVASHSCLTVVAWIAMARLGVTTDHSHVRLAAAGQPHKLYWLRSSFNIVPTSVMNILWITFSIMLYKYLSFFPGFPDVKLLLAGWLETASQSRMRCMEARPGLAFW
jgi:hypothetical protein